MTELTIGNTLLQCIQIMSDSNSLHQPGQKTSEKD
jgi:hypothetical protein